MEAARPSTEATPLGPVQIYREGPILPEEGGGWAGALGAQLLVLAAGSVPCWVHGSSCLSLRSNCCGWGEPSERPLGRGGQILGKATGEEPCCQHQSLIHAEGKDLHPGWELVRPRPLWAPQSVQSWAARGREKGSGEAGHWLPAPGRPHRRRCGTALVTSRKKGWPSADLAEMRLLGS